MPLKEDDPRVQYVVTQAIGSFSIERTKFLKSFLSEDNMTRTPPAREGDCTAAREFLFWRARGGRGGRRGRANAAVRARARLAFGSVGRYPRSRRPRPGRGRAPPRGTSRLVKPLLARAPGYRA